MTTRLAATSPASQVIWRAKVFAATGTLEAYCHNSASFHESLRAIPLDVDSRIDESACEQPRSSRELRVYQRASDLFTRVRAILQSDGLVPALSRLRELRQMRRVAENRQATAHCHFFVSIMALAFFRNSF